MPRPRAPGRPSKIPQKTSRLPERLDLSVRSVVKGQRVAVPAKAPSFVLTLESSSIEASCGGIATNVDRSSCLLVPAGGFVALRGSAAVSRVAVLAFQPVLVDAFAAAYAKLGIDRQRLSRWLERPEILPRTIWV